MTDTEFRPLEGNPDLLASKANHYAEIADAITRSVATLRRIHGTDSMKSKAVDAVRGKSDDVANDIDKARERYAVTAQALTTYSTSLRIAQDAATAAITTIEHKQTAATSAHHMATQSQQIADGSTADTKATDAAAATKAKDAADTADAELHEAQKAWHAALNDKNAAAEAAIGKIVEVVTGSKNHGLKDSIWDDFVGSDFFKVLKTVCDWAGVLAIFLSWVPILGQVLVVLAAVGAVLAVIQAAVKLDQGIGSWGDLLVAVGMGVLTCFGGKIFSVLGKNARGLVAAKGFSKVGGDLKAGKALQGEMAIGSRAATRLSKQGFRDVLKDPLFLSDAGNGFRFNGAGDFAKQALKSSLGKLTLKGNVGEDALALGNIAKNSPELLSAGQKAKTIASAYGSLVTNIGLDKLAIDTVRESTSSEKE